MGDQGKLEKLPSQVQLYGDISIGCCLLAAGVLNIFDPLDSTASMGENVISFAIAALCAINTAVTGWCQQYLKMGYFFIWAGTFFWAGTNDETTPGIIKKCQQIFSLCSIFLMWIDSVRRYESKECMVNAPNFIFLLFAASSGALQLSCQFFQKAAALDLTQAILKFGSGVFFIITAITRAIIYNLKKVNEEPENGDLGNPLLKADSLSAESGIGALSQYGDNASLGSFSKGLGATYYRYQGAEGKEHLLEIERYDSDEEATEINENENAKEEAGDHNSEGKTILEECGGTEDQLEIESARSDHYCV